MTTGKPVTSLSPFHSPVEEYQTAFEERQQPFLNYYAFKDEHIIKRSLTRGEFWELANLAASHLDQLGIEKGTRIIHFFASNSINDLIFRLAAVLVGCVPVTVNWQVDDNELIYYKTAITESKMLIYEKRLIERIKELKSKLDKVIFLEVEEVLKTNSEDRWISSTLNWDYDQIIIFTSGTTTKPKGVRLSYQNFLTSRLIFEDYFGLSGAQDLDLLIVNPLHHVNSTVLSDWGLRRKGTIIHLLERYTTAYWRILVETAAKKRSLLVTSLVSRHIDFLDALASESRLPVEEVKIREALNKTDILIGSAPVGPKTIKNIIRFSHRLPHVRFGSTETCLEVMATPTHMPHNELLKTFESGWTHHYQGEELVGYYIGREHFPFTRVKVVRSIEPKSNEYMHQCEVGEPGYLITEGPNVMIGYIGDPKATETVFTEGWYTGLRDVVFTLKNRLDDKLDYYWMSRDSEFLIRGGANYAYDQIAAELSNFVAENFHIEPYHFKISVIGLRLESEHEDSCCVTIELSPEVKHVAPKLKMDFMDKAAKTVSKGSQPDYLHLAPIPRNFKGAIIYPQLKRDFIQALKNKTVLKR